MLVRRNMGCEYCENKKTLIQEEMIDNIKVNYELHINKKINTLIINDRKRSREYLKSINFCPLCGAKLIRS